MRCVAFLRGMNVGGHRLTNAELCGHVAALGFANVSAFLASGNVVLDAGRRAGAAARLEDGLQQALGYAVPTFLRTAHEVLAIAGRDVFDAALSATCGKEQVLLLTRKPPPAARDAVLALASNDNRLEFHARELHWLPHAGVLDSDLDFARIERTIGPTTTRTKNTIRRLAAKYFANGEGVP